MTSVIRPTREICRLCWSVIRVGFTVPDGIWTAAMRPHLYHRPVDLIACLACFSRLADERGVEWDRDIEFFPISQVAHRRFVEEESS